MHDELTQGTPGAAIPAPPVFQGTREREKRLHGLAHLPDCFDRHRLKGDYLTILGRFVAEIEKVAERDAEPVCGASRWATGQCGGELNEPVSENGRPARMGAAAGWRRV